MVGVHKTNSISRNFSGITLGFHEVSKYFVDFWFCFRYFQKMTPKFQFCLYKFEISKFQIWRWRKFKKSILQLPRGDTGNLKDTLIHWLVSNLDKMLCLYTDRYLPILITNYWLNGTYWVTTLLSITLPWPCEHIRFWYTIRGQGKLKDWKNARRIVSMHPNIVCGKSAADILH